MSDVSGGPGWWQASDGRWYRPEQHPDYRAPSPPPGPPPLAGLPPAQPAPTTVPIFEPDLARQAMEEKGFFRSLFDFSISSFITMRLVRLLYIWTLVVLSLGAVAWVVLLVAALHLLGLLVAVIVVPIYYFVNLIFARIGVELMIIVFNIGKDVRAIRQQNERLAQT